MRTSATAHSRTELSPYEIMFGRIMLVGSPGEIPATRYSWEISRNMEFLADEMRHLHTAVKARKEEVKLQDKQAHDNANRVMTPQWTVGDLILLHDTRVRSRSNQVITGKRFHGPFVIQQVVQGDADVGQAYKLVCECDGNHCRI